MEPEKKTPEEEKKPDAPAAELDRALSGDFFIKRVKIV